MPEYCRPTPTDLLPCSRKPVSSSTPIGEWSKPVGRGKGSEAASKCHAIIEVSEQQGIPRAHQTIKASFFS